MPILKEKWPMTMDEVDELWKKSSEGFCDVKVVLPNIDSKSMLFYVSGSI